MQLLPSTFRRGACRLFGGLLICGLAAGSLRAAIVSNAGSDIGTATHDVGQWRTPSQAKPLDVDGNNVYGSAGYALFAATNDNVSPRNGTPDTFPTNGDPSAGATNLISLPTWVSSSAILTTQEASGWQYKHVDNPVTTPGVTPSTVKVGLLTNGTEDKWTFTIGNGAPLDFRFGVMIDGLDGNQHVASALSLRVGDGSTVGGSASVSTQSNIDGLVDMYFFDVHGAQTGDVFTLHAVDNGANAGVDGVSFDAVPVPEPATAVLAVIALGWLGCARFKKRRGAAAA